MRFQDLKEEYEETIEASEKWCRDNGLMEDVNNLMVKLCPLTIENSAYDVCCFLVELMDTSGYDQIPGDNKGKGYIKNQIKRFIKKEKIVNSKIRTVEYVGRVRGKRVKSSTTGIKHTWTSNGNEIKDEHSVREVHELVANIILTASTDEEQQIKIFKNLRQMFASVAARRRLADQVGYWSSRSKKLVGGKMMNVRMCTTNPALEAGYNYPTAVRKYCSVRLLGPLTLVRQLVGEERNSGAGWYKRIVEQLRMKLPREGFEMLINGSGRLAQDIGRAISLISSYETSGILKKNNFPRGSVPCCLFKYKKTRTIEEDFDEVCTAGDFFNFPGGENFGLGMRDAQAMAVQGFIMSADGFTKLALNLKVVRKPRFDRGDLKDTLVSSRSRVIFKILKPKVRVTRGDTTDKQTGQHTGPAGGYAQTTKERAAAAIDKLKNWAPGGAMKFNGQVEGMDTNVEYWSFNGGEYTKGNHDVGQAESFMLTKDKGVKPLKRKAADSGTNSKRPRAENMDVSN